VYRDKWDSLSRWIDFLRTPIDPIASAAGSNDARWSIFEDLP
jgi:hypothetical protein